MIFLYLLLQDVKLFQVGSGTAIVWSAS